MDSSKGSAARIGFVVFIAMVVVIAAVYFVGDGGGIFREYTRYEVRFPSTGGLRPDAKVFLEGVPVGKVDDIGFPENPNEKGIVVSLAIYSKVAGRLHDDSLAWIQTQGLLGDKEVQITGGTPGKPKLPAGAAIQGTDRSAIEDLVGHQLASSTSDLLENLVDLLKEVNAGKGTLGQFLKNPELYNNMNDFTRSLAVAANELSGVSRDLRGMIDEVHNGKGTLGKLIFSEAYAQEFTRAIQGANLLLDEVAKVLEPVARGEGTVGKLLKDGTLHGEIQTAVGRLAAVAGRIDGAMKSMEDRRSALDRLIRDPDMGDRVGRLVANLERSAGLIENILEKIDGGQGSIGMLVNDPSIAASARDVFVGVRENNVLTSLVRKAEVHGQEIYFRDEKQTIDLGKRETERVLRKEGLKPPVEPGRGPGEDSGAPLPAAGREGEGAPVPAPGRAVEPRAPASDPPPSGPSGGGAGAPSTGSQAR